MSDVVYEVRVAGLVPAEEVLDGDQALEIVSRSYRTVLVGRFAHRDGLLEFLRELRGHGFEVVNVRRLPGHLVERHAPADAEPVDAADHDLTPYEMTVPGELGPAGERLLDSFRVVLTELHTLLRAKTAPELGPVELGLILESRGLKVASITSSEAPGRVPSPRDKAQTPDSSYDEPAEAPAH